jgi:hypothetical protein
MATFRVLTQCMMITGIKIRASFFFSHSRVHTHHRLLDSTRVDLIGKERVDIFTSLSHQLYKNRNNDNYTLLFLCVETFESERDRTRKREKENECLM